VAVCQENYPKGEKGAYGGESALWVASFGQTAWEVPGRSERSAGYAGCNRGDNLFTAMTFSAARVAGPSPRYCEGCGPLAIDRAGSLRTQQMPAKPPGRVRLRNPRRHFRGR